MPLHPLAGKPAPESLRTDLPGLMVDYYRTRPNPADPGQQVAFGTSGHRGKASEQCFNEAHILAITQAIVDYRGAAGITGPLFLGMDTHALSSPAHQTALEVLAANEITVFIQTEDVRFTPTPAISHAILTWNRSQASKADGIVITPSHNPPADGGFKYNPPHGGPAEGDITRWVQDAANQYLASDLSGIKRTAVDPRALPGTIRRVDLVGPYVAALNDVLDMEAIQQAGVSIGVDPLGGAALPYWERIADVYQLDLTIVNPSIDPAFMFMRVDKDGVIRMDCSSAAAMAGLIDYRDQFSIALGNDPDADRHGIVTPTGGLMNPNHYLAVAIEYLFTHRNAWSADLGIGKTLVSSAMIDRVAERLGRKLVEVPVGFKWFVDGLYGGTLGFGGEESAGASFLRKDGLPWSTDKDGILLGLLAVEICAVTGMDPSEHYTRLTDAFGAPQYRRVDAPATDAIRATLGAVDPDRLADATVGGDTVARVSTQASGNGASIGGVKVETERGWFAARPSGTEPIYKIYAESFEDTAHLDLLIADAQDLIATL